MPLHRLPVAAALTLLLASASGLAQSAGSYAEPGETRAVLAEALAAQRLAARRAGRLEADAAHAVEAADRTARAGAALAARVQQAEAGIAAGEARLALISGQRIALRTRLAVRQAPLVRLTGALQLMTRRPLVLGALRPGSLTDLVHLRAVFATTLPVVQARTAGLRAELARARALEAAARREQAGLRNEQARLGERRRELAALETRQRLASRASRGAANREADRATALAEKARDLSGLVGELEAAGALRQRLAALPGPVLRPARPGAAQVAEIVPTASPSGRLSYIPPVAGRIVTGFGEASSGGGLRAKGITFAPAAGAQVVAPAAGRVAFAGRYEGYGRIVILEHDGGWTTLVTGLAAATPAVGDTLVQGAPIGVAGPGRPTVTVELRKDGEPVDIVAIVAGR